MNNVLQFFSKFEDGFIYFGTPAVTFYHLLCSNVFLNTAAEDAYGFEKMGNIVLTPFRYIFAGRIAIPAEEEGKYAVEQYFDYHDHLFLRTTAAIASLPFSVVFGSLLKGMAFASSDVQKRHRAIVDSLRSLQTVSHRAYYQSQGIDLSDPDTSELLSHQGYQRRPEDEGHLSEEKKAFALIVNLFKEHGIIFWADCGTCLGAYRYGGMIPWDNDLDLAILEPDFSNMKHALNALDSSLYLVEDWSNRCLPNTYARVYIRSTRQYIDIYTYAIHPAAKSVHYIFSSENCMFMLEGWKVNERRYMVETPFEVIFPLRLALFDGIEIPVPNQTQRYLQMRYGENLSPVKIYNAQTGAYEKDPSHPYWERAYVH
jgi:hypothetical protein